MRVSPKLLSEESTFSAAPDYPFLIEDLESQFPEFNGFDFYNYVFPNMEFSFESGLPNPRYASTPIYLYRSSEGAMKRRMMLRDTWESDYCDFIEENFCSLCSGLSYIGKKNNLQAARYMYALIFDLDGVGYSELKSLFLRFGKKPRSVRALPYPTFLVISGTGLHVYYVFDEPIALFPNIQAQLKAMKYELTEIMWHFKSTTKVQSIQYQSINQAFRMVGSVNEKYGCRIRAFKVGDKVSLDYLNSYVSPENQVDLTKRYRPTTCTLEEAKVLYPDWFERREHNRMVKQLRQKGGVSDQPTDIIAVDAAMESSKVRKWRIEEKVHGSNPYALYDWWLNQVHEVQGGHRYFYMMCCVIYGMKCGVPRVIINKDLDKIYKVLKSIEHLNPLTKSDLKKAKSIYNLNFEMFTISEIEHLSGIHIKRNKRNKREQSTHLKIARAINEVLHPDGTWRNLDGRPIKKDEVLAWRQQHPAGTKAQCVAQTGLSKPTVYKWWDFYSR